MSRKTCAHPPTASFIAFRGKRGAIVWRCSQCGKEDVWRDTWQYWGSYECRACSAPEVFAVLCSDACKSAYKPTEAIMALAVGSDR